MQGGELQGNASQADLFEQDFPREESLDGTIQVTAICKTCQMIYSLSGDFAGDTKLTFKEEEMKQHKVSVYWLLITSQCPS
jgi:hypothetical protein